MTDKLVPGAAAAVPSPRALSLGVSRSGWRNFERLSKTRIYQDLMKVVVERDGALCRFCGFSPLGTQSKVEAPKKAPWDFRASSYLELHNISGNHRDFTPANVVLACPFCEETFHAGTRSLETTGRLIWFPWMTQADLNLLFNLMAVAIHRDGEHAEAALHLYSQIESYERPASALVGRDMLDIGRVATGLLALMELSPQAYRDRSKALGDCRFLPRLGLFSEAVAWWSEHGWPEEDIWNEAYELWTRSRPHSSV